MTRPLRIELTRYAVDCVDDRESGKDRRVEIVTEIEAYRTNRCLVMHPQADRVRNVVKVTLRVGRLVRTEIGILLFPTKQAVDHIARLGEHVPHVMKNGETDVVLDKWQVCRREPQFKLVQKQAAPPGRIPSLKVSWSCLI